jgi:hypothetical protein
VWRGGSTLTGTPALRATLAVPAATEFDALCGVANGQGLLLADLTGDGTLDVIAAASSADAAAVDDGAIHVWEGGATLSGVPARLATFAVPGAASGDLLGAAVDD